MFDVGNIALLMTAVLSAGAAGVVYCRFNLRPDTNLPLFYYLALWMYSNSMRGVVNPYVIYVALIAALLMRFEFLNERFVILLKLVEIPCILYVGWQLAQYLVKYF